MDKFEMVTNADGSVDMARSDKGLWYDSEEVDARIAELEKALQLIAAYEGKALLGDGRYDEGANAAFNQMAHIASNA